MSQNWPLLQPAAVPSPLVQTSAHEPFLQTLSPWHPGPRWPFAVTLQLPLPLHVPGRQVPSSQSPSGSEPERTFLQRPSPPPVSALRQDLQAPEHVFSQHTPSAHAPVIHSPLLPQLAPSALRHSFPVLLDHIPSGLQTCGVVPTHCLSPGTHCPAQSPLPRQTNMHVSDATHRPALLHVCTALPMHRLAPGEQSPVQAPAEHTAVHAAMLCHRAF